MLRVAPVCMTLRWLPMAVNANSAGVVAPRSAGANLVLLVCAIAIGLAAMLGLAAFMHTLITSSEMQLSKVDQIQMLDFVRLKREESVERKDRKPQRPEVTQAPDTPPMMEESSGGSSEALAVSALAPVSPGLEIDSSGGGLGTGDGEYLPIVKVAPIYPRRALAKGLSGTCLVRYTVTTLGTVRDVSVVMDACSDPIFARPSEEAAKRFKYKPRVIDGVAVEVIGVQNMFHFERVRNQREADER